MRAIQPSRLTTEELIRHADQQLLSGALPDDWQKEILNRLEKMLYSGDPLTTDPRQLSLF